MSKRYYRVKRVCKDIHTDKLMFVVVAPNLSDNPIPELTETNLVHLFTNTPIGDVLSGKNNLYVVQYR